MIYRALCCPKCGFQIFDARTVRYLTTFTKKMDYVGVSMMVLRCPGCHKAWGIVIAADEKCWMLSTVELVNLQQEYRRIREAVAKGMDVEQVLAWTTQHQIQGDIAS